LTTLTRGFLGRFLGRNLREGSPKPLVPFFLALLFLCSAAAAHSQNTVAVYEPDSGYYLRKTYAVKAAQGSNQESFSGIIVDAPARRVYVAHGTELQVMDADSGALIGTIPGFTQNDGIAIASDLGRGFITDRAQAKVVIFDLSTLKTVGEAKTDAGVSNIIYDSASKRIFTMNGRAGTSTAIDAATGKVAGTVQLGGGPEFAAADGEGHVFANLEDKSALVEIDSRTLKLENTWPLAPCESPSGLAIDAAHKRLVVGCHNKLMAFVDSTNGKVVGTVPIGQGVDANRFDPGTGFAFASCGDGTLAVAHEDSPDKFTPVEQVTTQRGARTMELDLKTHTVYLVTAEFGPAPAPTADNPRPRPKVLPDTFTLLVFTK